MKKLLILSTTILFPLIANAAEMPKVKLGGRMDTIVAHTTGKKEFRTQNPSSANGARVNDTVIVNDTKLDINIDGKAAYDLKYGGMIRINADASPTTGGETTVGDKAMTYVQHDKIGRLEVGNTPGAGALFEMDILFFNKGSWGVDGFSTQFVEDKTKRFSAIPLPTTVDTRGFEFIESPNLVSNYSGKYYSDAPKANFFTKPVDFLTIGVTFIPDLDSAGTIKGVAGKHSGPADSLRAKNPATYRNIVSGGFQFDKEIVKNIQLKTSVVGEIGDAKNSKIRDLKAYELGFMLAFYKDIKLGATYGNWGKSLTVKDSLPGAKQRADYWTAGFGHQIEKFGYAVTYLNSQKAGGIEALSTSTPLPLSSLSDYSANKYSNVVIDVDYELAPGFLPYAGVSFYNFKESTGAKDNGNVVMVGTRLIF